MMRSSRRRLPFCLVVVSAAVALTFAPGVAAAAKLHVLAQGDVVVAQGVTTASTTPVNGQLRGPDSQTVVTAVAWPYRADGYVASTSQRLVAFTVQLTEPTSDATGFGSTGPTLSLIVEGSPKTLDATDIANEVGDSTGNTGTGTESYVASVPDDTKSVDVSMTDLGYTQSFSLWTLERTTPAPSVLYQDPTSSSITEQIGVTKTLTIHDPSFGDNLAEVLISTAQLSAFNPAGTDETAPLGHDYLVLSMTANETQGEFYADNFLMDLAPLPGSAVTLTIGRRRYEAQRSDITQPTPSSSDDGLLDATYAFLVPSDTTHGVVAIGPGSTTGQTYDNYLNSGPVDAMTVSGPVRFSVGFPRASGVERQPAPPWWSEPDPVTGLTSGSGGDGGLSIAVAVVALAAVAATTLTVRRRRTLVFHPEVPGEVGTTSVTPVPVSEPAVDSKTEPMRVDFLGPVRISGLAEAPGEFARAFLCYLAVHSDRPRTVDDAQTALWPLDETESDVTRKTFLNYVSDVRRLVSPRHLPTTQKRSAYRLVDAVSDWEEFRTLATEAARAAGPTVRELRTRALELVRGVPFESELSRWFQWTDSQGVRTEITKAVVKMAVDAHAERIHAGDLDGAEWALRRGLRCNPMELALWEYLADVVQARADRGDTERFWRDAAAALDKDDVCLLRERVRG